MWYRKIIPAGYALATLHFVGTAPLLMNSDSADQEGELFRAYRNLSVKSRKSLDDEARLREMQWQLAMYLDEDLGPYIPETYVIGALSTAATKWRKGTTIKHSLVVLQDRIPLEYDGPRTQQELWDAGFRDTRMVTNAGFNRGRVVRCRPCFDNWEVTAEIAFDPEEIDPDTLDLVVERSQKFGFGDYRPRFGSFRATITHGVVHKDTSNGLAVSEVEERERVAHAAQRERIMTS